MAPKKVEVHDTLFIKVPYTAMIGRMIQWKVPSNTWLLKLQTCQIQVVVNIHTIQIKFYIPFVHVSFTKADFWGWTNGRSVYTVTLATFFFLN